MRRNRSGIAAIEVLMVLTTFVLAVALFTIYGIQVMRSFVGDGNQLTGVPLY